jgi:diguanylate cyclase (GGDEF)-like protein
MVEGARVGALTLMSSSVAWFHDEEQMLLQEVAATMAFAMRSQRDAQAAQFLTNYDPLTGLAKRALFCERFNAVLKHGKGPLDRLVVSVFDVRDLSGLNDTFGRSVGDSIVQKIAERMRRAVENDECIGYLGSGMFVLWVREFVGAPNNVVAAIENAVFGQSFELAGRSFPLTCRSGTARHPTDGLDAPLLVERAEAAMRHAKESGERYLHFKLQMHSEVANRLQLEHRLRDAVEGKQFVLHYQPQVNIATGRIEAVEALLRWRDPDGGLVAPAVFLPVLESTGLIFEVGTWVLTQALQDCKRWRSRSLTPVRVAVNVSPLQIRRRLFAEEVLEIIDATGAAECGLDIEITESSLLQDLEDANRKLNRLRRGGIRVAIDDFGTGYSSLGLLPNLPVDILKIDRIFIRDLPDARASASLTSGIIQIASALNLVTVAEGVETSAQLAMLRGFGCAQSQGFLHSRPVPAAEFEVLLEREATAPAL